MRCKLLKINGTWRDVADAARTTARKEAGTGEPSSSWKRRMLLAEHSPIRKIRMTVKWFDIFRWVNDHFARHWVGLEHFVGSQREDKTGVPRSKISQCEPTDHELDGNPQSYINISRKRLCVGNASPETIAAWKEALEEIRETQPELYSVCVPDCCYRGWCYEMKSRGYHKSPEFQEKLAEYRANINV